MSSVGKGAEKRKEFYEICMHGMKSSPSAFVNMNDEFARRFSVNKAFNPSKLPGIKVELLGHQKTTLAAMSILSDTHRNFKSNQYLKDTRSQLEESFRTQTLFDTETSSNQVQQLVPVTPLETTFGVLADPPGAGKSLCAIVAALNFVPRLTDEQLQRKAFQQLSVREVVTGHMKVNINPCMKQSQIRILDTTIIIVPKSTIAQWKSYIEDLTDCKNYLVLNEFMNDFKNLQNGEVYSRIFDQRADSFRIVVMGEIAMRKASEDFRDRPECVFKSIYIDEADSIDLDPSLELPHCLFAWFITATPFDFMVGACKTTRFRKMFFSTGQTTDIQRRNINNLRVSMRCLISNDEDFVKRNLNLPAPVENMVTIYMSDIMKHLYKISPENAFIQLSAGDLKGAIRSLGQSESRHACFIGAMLHRMREDIRQKIGKRKGQVSADVMIKYDEEIEHAKRLVDELLKVIKRSEECPITMAPIHDRYVAPCCGTSFEARALKDTLNSINTEVTKTEPTCPICASFIRPSSVNSSEKPKSMDHNAHPSKKQRRVGENTYLKKEAITTKIIDEAPAGSRFLVFSSFDTNGIENYVKKNTKNDVSVESLKNARTKRLNERLNDYRTADEKKKALFLDANSFAAGINLQNTSHIITLHEMNEQRYTQLIGRAQRLGRKEAVNVYNLRSEWERKTTSSSRTQD